MSRSHIYAAAFLLILMGSPAKAQSAADPGMPAEATAATDTPAVTDPEKPASDEECNLPCQIVKSPLTPGGGGGVATAKEIVIFGGESNQLELGIPRPEAHDFRLRTEQF